MKTQEEPYAIRGITLQKGNTLCTAVCGENEYFAVGLSTGSVNLFPFNKSDKIIRLKCHKGAIRNVQYSPEKSVLATGSDDGTICLWEYPNGKIISNISIGSQLLTMHLNSSFSRLITISKDNVVSVWNPLNSSKIIEIKNKEGNTASACHVTDAGVFVTGYTNGSLQIFDARAGIVTNCITVSSCVTSIASKGTLVAIGCESGEIVLWDYSTEKLIGKDSSHKAPISSIDFHPTNDILIVASLDNSISFIDSSTMSQTLTLNCHTAPVLSVKFSCDGSTFSSCGKDNRIVLWKFPEMKETITNYEEEEEYEEITHELERRYTVEDNRTNKSQMQCFVSMIHGIADQIVSLSATVSKLESKMHGIDKQIAYLESVKRKQAKNAIKNAAIE